MLHNRLIFGQPRTLRSMVQLRFYDPSERIPLTPEQQRKYPQVQQEISDEGYPILKLGPRRPNMFSSRPKFVRKPPSIAFKIRELSMKEDQDWPSMWPVAKTFVPSAVPLPMRQSYESKSSRVARGKYANTELLRIVNFLHLTPEAIRRQCAAIRKFCTTWPEGLDTDEEVRVHFPVTFVTRDYCHSSQNIRDIRARCVELKVNINDLKLKGRDRIKLIELARHRYDPETEMLSILADACPMRVQNQDYSDYLLSAVYFESQEHQPWENERFDEDAFKNINLDEYRKSIEQRLGFNK